MVLLRVVARSSARLSLRSSASTTMTSGRTVQSCYNACVQKPQQWRRLLTSSSKSNSSSSPTKTKTGIKEEPIATTPKTPPPQEPDVPHLLPKVFCIGSLAGMCGSLAGMGGGFIMIPLMTSARLLRLNQHQAHGTSLFAVAATGVAGALGYQGQVEYDAAASIAACGVVTAGFGASMTTRLSAAALKKALGIFMILVAPLVPLKAYLKDDSSDGGTTDGTTPDYDEEQPSKPWQQRLLPPAMIGLCSGFLAGLFGVGGGAVVVPALTLCTDMNHYQALGTSLCAMAFPAIAGTLTHYRKGNVALRVAPALAVGAFCGGYVGGRLGMQIDENALRWGFSGIMVTLGLRSLIR